MVYESRPWMLWKIQKVFVSYLIVGLLIIRSDPTVALVLPTSSFSLSSPLLFSRMWDYLAPVRHVLEKKVASQSIPNVSNIPDRRRIQDYLAQDDDESTSTRKFDHSLWTKVLQRHVTKGCTFGFVTNVNAVDYNGISNDKDFEQYLQLLEMAQPDQLAPLEQLAFWMNVYNALCIATIVQYEKTKPTDAPPLKSITQLSNPIKGPIWDQVVVGRQVGGQDITLHVIEHERLRAVWAEPAVHACIVCASASCPNLRPEAYEASKLLFQMTDQMKDWLSNPTKGLKLTSLSSSSDPSPLSRFQSNTRLELSRIFLWFADDFGGKEGLQEWLPQFIDESQTVTEETMAQAAWRYFEYDWQINRASTASLPSTEASVTTGSTASQMK